VISSSREAVFRSKFGSAQFPPTCTVTRGTGRRLPLESVCLLYAVRFSCKLPPSRRALACHKPAPGRWLSQQVHNPATFLYSLTSSRTILFHALPSSPERSMNRRHSTLVDWEEARIPCQIGSCDSQLQSQKRGTNCRWGRLRVTRRAATRDRTSDRHPSSWYKTFIIPEQLELCEMSPVEGYVAISVRTGC
jgi:hypothetical protein